MKSKTAWMIFSGKKNHHPPAWEEALILKTLLLES
jgi:hypothetical protein